ncbi:BatA domain-containing protein [Membranihabitans marinus]|uniref:BatA domain-containing protein n=1 Tax=Membranihabitans marinus TaxID=1227546 RepID=UPI001F1D2522|nr:BatA domain-containing protein [Membranihabitans marinus]
MQFVFPLFLVALASIIIPIIIHLFYFQRYKTEYFSNVGFLKNLKEEKKSRSRLKNILVLLARIFFITFLVLAFAQPFMTDEEDSNTDSDYISIFIDNSFSMGALSSETPLLQVAINKAKEILNAYSESTSFQILTNDLLPGDQRLLSRDLALQKLDEIDYSGRPMQLDRIAQYVERSLKDHGGQSLSYWISDFQKNGLQNPLSIDTSLQILPLPIRSVVNKNVSIDSCWFASPVPEANVENQLYVKISNYGTEDQDVKIVLKDGENIKPLGAVFIEEGKSVIDTLQINLSRTSLDKIVLEITDHPIDFDNRYYLSLNNRPQLKILDIYEDNVHEYMDRILRNNATVEKTEVNLNRIVYSDFSNKDLLVLDHLPAIHSGLTSNLSNYIEQGGNVLLFPPRNLDLNSYNEFLNSVAELSFEPWKDMEMEAQSLNFQDFVFNDVFDKEDENINLPKVQGYYGIRHRSNHPVNSLMTLRNGENLILKVAKGNGYLYLSTTPLTSQYSNLGSHADVFVPMVYRMALSKGRSRQQSYTIGEDETIVVATENQYEEGELLVSGDEVSFIPGFRQVGDLLELNIYDQIKEDGLYQLSQNQDDIASFAMNYSRVESDISTWNIEDLQEKITGNVRWLSTEQSNNLSQFVEESYHGKVLWKWCLIFALIFLVVESLLLRFIKN